MLPDLFNPAGLRVLEDRQGAIAYGYVAHRVFYVRLVGCLSAELGVTFVEELDGALGETASAACFADASALRACDAAARSRFEAFVGARRAKLGSIVILTWAGGVEAASRAFVDALGQPAHVLSEPLEFERALCNVTPLPGRTWVDLAQVWQVHAPR